MRQHHAAPGKQGIIGNLRNDGLGDAAKGNLKTLSSGLQPDFCSPVAREISQPGMTARRLLQRSQQLILEIEQRRRNENQFASNTKTIVKDRAPIIVLEIVRLPQFLRADDVSLYN
ncbi:hypothetical protein F8B91_13225 [Aestuariivirga litoralis]|nr:hypothetical protein [Aestuariivirga litoralis]